MASDCLVFEETSLIRHGYYEGCSLTITSNGFEIKSLKSGVVECVTPNDIKSVSWCQMAKKFGLKIVSEGGLFYQLSSIDSQDFEKISNFLASKCNIILKKQEISVKGKNQGDLSLECISASSLKFNVDLATCFEIPLKDICRVSSSKNEVGMEFHHNDAAPVSLMEIRLHVPNESVQRLVEQLSTKADVMKATTNAIFSLPEVACMTPRYLPCTVARIKRSIYPSFLELHGKTFDFKIPHATILRIFCLFHSEKKNYIVVNVVGAEGSQASEKPYHQTFCEILNKLSQNKVYSSGEFKSHLHNDCLACACKASNGLLYPLERGFLFIHKPTIYVPFDQISCVDFARGTLSARTFDMEIDSKNGQTM
ncbi:hypothetical protein MXB_3766, partial [Myxobolus squamalis]